MLGILWSNYVLTVLDTAITDCPRNPSRFVESLATLAVFSKHSRAGVLVLCISLKYHSVSVSLKNLPTLPEILQHTISLHRLLSHFLHLKCFSPNNELTAYKQQACWWAHNNSLHLYFVFLNKFLFKPNMCTVLFRFTKQSVFCCCKKRLLWSDLDSERWQCPHFRFFFKTPEAIIRYEWRNEAISPSLDRHFSSLSSGWWYWDSGALHINIYRNVINHESKIWLIKTVNGGHYSFWELRMGGIVT